jgi:hypothetical protein
MELLGSPRTTGMQRVAWGPVLWASAPTVIKVAKSIERHVPEWLELLNEQRCPNGTPAVIDNQKPTVEVLEIQFPAMPN